MAVRRKGLRVPFRWRYWPWLAMCGLAALAIGLGYAGFSEHLATRGESLPPLTILYLAIQLFVLESGAVAGPLPWQLDVARFLAPVVAAWAVVQTLALVFRDEFRALCVRRWKGHTIVCGLGERGMALVRGFRDAGERVVAIESDEGNDDIATCEELGAVVRLGRGDDPALLASVGAHRARRIIAVCGDDGTNLEIGTSLHWLLAAAGGSGKPPDCFVHVTDLRLCNLLRQHRLMANTPDYLRLRMFNVYENAARLLWNEHPLERDLSGPDDPRRPHLVILGLGQMGESVLLQAARTAHFANGRPLKVTVIDREADKREGSLLQRYPNLNQVCETQFLEVDVESGSFGDRLSAWVGGDDLIRTVAVCFDDDSRSLACALAVAGKLDDAGIPVLVRMSSRRGLASLLQSEGKGAGRRLHAFGAVSRSCSREVLLGGKLDELARAAHDDYVANRRREGAYREDDPSLRPWEELDEQLRESNRYQADHMAAKLRAVGCCLAPPQPGKEPVQEFTDAEVELMARMEHARWNAERLLAGWQYGPRRDPENMRSPYLVPWEDLPEEIKEYDRQAVRNIPHLVHLAEQRTYRNGR